MPDSTVTELKFVDEELENAYEGVAIGTKVMTADAAEVIVALLLLSGTSVNILKSRLGSLGLSKVLLKQLCRRVALAAL